MSGIIDKTAGKLDSHGANNSSLKTQPPGIRLTGITDSIFFLEETSEDEKSCSTSLS